MVTQNKSLCLHPEVAKLGEEISKHLHMSFSSFVSGLIVKVGLELDNMIQETGYNESVIFEDLARKLNSELRKLKFRVEA